eukprot:CAMPEP_0206458840 /NCGR_PEP_ID=MMETSP0324_2-20121206/23813_1 /ASSEMBLY_ACC=CAM_ASM_000836 /TAXON_ID=2866 /ORGANISM="Crypthecodinium cohnii, Strain Seligo" /LENGTH=193 /DNA_ID=CAMNT_0053930263 /DNA_START=74 /DNA_END=655 /DNA_ORIENTATION=-
MAEEAAEKVAATAREAGIVAGEPLEDLYYVPESSLKLVEKMLNDGKKEEADYKSFADQVVDPWEVNDDETMVPVDMRCFKQYENLEEMMDQLGVVGFAEAFVKARKHFVDNPDKVPEDQRPENISAVEWKAMLMEGEEEEAMMDDDEEEEEEDLLPEDDEDELREDGEEEGAAEGEAEDNDAEEPPSKKARTE